MADIDDYKEQRECVYKDEHFLVRDNGAVLRLPREGKKARQKDNVWTFGTPNDKGYLAFCGVVVHRIVATAFRGEAPSPQHVVDHIDINHQNNRADNLRWLTRLENTLNNPITRAKVVKICGSVEAFLENPQLLWNHVNKEPNFSWMRTVTKEEAANSLARWTEWAKFPSVSGEGQVGDWIFTQPSDGTGRAQRTPVSSLPRLQPIEQVPAEVPEPDYDEEEDDDDEEEYDRSLRDNTCTSIEAKYVHLVPVTQTCWQCGKKHWMYYIKFVSTENGDQYYEHEDYETKLYFEPIVIRSVTRYMKENHLPMGEIKPRYSKTLDDEYMSFGCPYCDAMVGSWFVHEVEIDLCYEKDKHFTKVELDEPLHIELRH